MNSSKRFAFVTVALFTASTVCALAGAAAAKRSLTPGGVWLAHDTNRPRPAVVIPPTASTEAVAGRPPSDAVVLFDGKDLSQWRRVARRTKGNADASETPAWKVEHGYMEVVPKSGGLASKAKFADCQLHIEWATPTPPSGTGQGRGNSGIFIDGHPEIQVLDSYQNDTYPDGQAGGLYGLYPPLVNPTRPPGEWQSFDIIYVAPRLEEGKVVQPARYTVLLNGVLLHHAVEVPGSAVECSISLQDHNNPIRYRNIWVRPLKGYDAR
jgi:hypothetical protein